MITVTTNSVDAIKAAIAQLLPGESLLMRDVAWEEYKQLTEDMNVCPGVRLTYDRGKLEITSPLPIHEKYKDFYVANAAAIIGKRKIDLRTDPPPDVTVEIGITHPSNRKLSSNEEMQVPEVWVYNEKQLRIFLLGDAGYNEFPHSQSFQMLTSDVLTQLLEQSKTKGQGAVLRKFQDWIKTQIATES